MSDQEEVTVEQLQSDIARLNKQLAAHVPESGFSMNWSLIDPVGCAVQMTARAPLLGDWGRVIDARHTMVVRLQEHGWTVPGPAGRAPVAASESAPVDAPTPAPTPSAAPAQNGGEAYAVRAVMWEVLPDAEGKVQIKFYGNDKKQPHNQYPDVYATKTPEAWAAMMPFIGAEAWQRVGKYNTPLIVRYVLSDKLNSKGNPYKNLTAVEAA